MKNIYYSLFLLPVVVYSMGNEDIFKPNEKKIDPGLLAILRSIDAVDDSSTKENKRVENIDALKNVGNAKSYDEAPPKKRQKLEETVWDLATIQAEKPDAYIGVHGTNIDIFAAKIQDKIYSRIMDELKEFPNTPMIVVYLGLLEERDYTESLLKNVNYFIGRLSKKIKEETNEEPKTVIKHENSKSNKALRILISWNSSDTKD